MHVRKGSGSPPIQQRIIKNKCMPIISYLTVAVHLLLPSCLYLLLLCLGRHLKNGIVLFCPRSQVTCIFQLLLRVTCHTTSAYINHISCQSCHLSDRAIPSGDRNFVYILYTVLHYRVVHIKIMTSNETGKSSGVGNCFYDHR